MEKANNFTYKISEDKELNIEKRKELEYIFEIIFSNTCEVIIDDIPLPKDIIDFVLMSFDFEEEFKIKISDDSDIFKDFCLKNLKNYTVDLQIKSRFLDVHLENLDLYFTKELSNLVLTFSSDEPTIKFLNLKEEINPCIDSLGIYCSEREQVRENKESIITIVKALLDMDCGRKFRNKENLSNIKIDSDGSNIKIELTIEKDNYRTDNEDYFYGRLVHKSRYSNGENSHPFDFGDYLEYLRWKELKKRDGE